MKKNKVLLGLMLGTLLIGSLSYSNTFEGITRERAMEIANREYRDGSFKSIELEIENGRRYYDVELWGNSGQVEMKIDAITGEVISWKEKHTRNNEVLREGEKVISREEARRKALSLSKNGQILKMELDRENGRLIYEIEIAEGYSEREIDLDAITGEVLKNILD